MKTHLTKPKLESNEMLQVDFFLGQLGRCVVMLENNALAYETKPLSKFNYNLLNNNIRQFAKSIEEYGDVIRTD